MTSQDIADGRSPFLLLRKRIATLGLILTASLAPASVALAESPRDQRTLVDLPAPMRAHMLANMRDHLAAIKKDLAPHGGLGSWAACRRSQHLPNRETPLCPKLASTLCHVAARVQRVQERLGMPLVVENVSSYLRFRESALTEAEFLAELSARTDCGLLLDVNNLYVNQANHGDDLDAALAALPPWRVQELHLAGFAQRDGWLLDAHAAPVAAPVWAVYERVQRWLAAAGVGAVPTLIEWDNDIPELGTLRAEAARADAIAARASAATAAVL